jgi:hypothetical protein
MNFLFDNPLIVLVLFLWSIVGLGLAVAACRSKAWPPKRRILLILVSGPIVWALSTVFTIAEFIAYLYCRICGLDYDKFN